MFGVPKAGACEKYLNEFAKLAIMSASEFNEVLDKLPSHLREQVYIFAQFLLAQEEQGTDERQERVLGLHLGAIETTEDFDAPLPESFWLGEE